MKLKVAAITLTLLFVALLAIAPVSAESLTVNVEKSVLLPGETLKVYGSAPAGSYVGVSIVNPKGEEVDYKQVVAGPDNTYSVTFKTPSTLPYGKWVAGTYTVTAYLGSTTASTTFTLSPGAKVVGKVVDSKGNPIAGAEVLVVEKGDSTTTKADGTFELYTSTGKYTLKVSKANYMFKEVSVSLAMGDNNVGTITLVSYDEVISSLNATIAQLQALVNNLANRVKSVENQVAVIPQLQALINNLQSTLASLNNKVSSLEGQVATISQLQASVKGLQDMLASLDNRVKSVENQVAVISQLQSLTNSLNSAVQQLSKTTDSMQNTVQSLRDTVSGMQMVAYAGIIAGVIGVVLAIVAMAYVAKKVKA